MRRNGLDMHQGRVRLNVRKKKIFTERVVKQWNRLPRELTELSLLKVHKRHIAMVLRDMA